MFQARVYSCVGAELRIFCVRRHYCGTCSQSSCVETELRTSVAVYFLCGSGIKEVQCLIPCAEAEFQIFKSHTIQCAEAELQYLKSQYIPSAEAELRHCGT